MKRTSLVINTVGVLGALLSMVVLVGITSRMVEPEQAPSDPKAAERMQKLSDMRSSVQSELTQMAALDENNQVVRLPIDKAIDVMLKEWEDPAKGHQWLQARYQRMKGDISSMQTLASGGELLVSDEASAEASEDVVDFFGGDSGSEDSDSSFESFDSFDSGSESGEGSADFEGSVDDAFGDF